MNYESSTQEAFFATWHWLCVISMMLFQIGFVWRWVQTHAVSSGHTVIGGTAVFFCLVLLMVLMWATAFSWFFTPFALLSTAVWLLYNDWYFHNYKNYAAIIADPRNGPDTFGMQTTLAKLLIQKPDGKIFWTADRVKWTMIVAVPLLLAGFGFSERLNAIAAADKRVAAVLQTTQKQSLANRDSVAMVINRLEKNVIDTVKKGQRKILAKVDSTNRNATAAKLVARLTADKVDMLGKKSLQQGRVVERAFRGNIYAPPPLRSATPSFRLPSVVAPAPVSVPPKKRGRIGYEYDVELDSLPFWVRSQNYNL